MQRTRFYAKNTDNKEIANDASRSTGRGVEQSKPMQDRRLVQQNRQTSADQSSMIVKSSPNRETYQLSLQLIQSNFYDASTPFCNNNGFPVAGTNPIIINVLSEQLGHKVTLTIPSFSFTIPPFNLVCPDTTTTPVGAFGAFPISMTVLPREVSPSSALWIDFNAGNGIAGHVFRDGSIRFSRPNGDPLPIGSYTTAKATVKFSNENCPDEADGFFEFNGRLVAKKNFPISAGLTNTNNVLLSPDGTPTGGNGKNYSEYYGMQYLNGKIYTVTWDNSYDQTSFPVPVFNMLDSEGNHLTSQVQIYSPSIYKNAPLQARTRNLGEPTLAVNPNNPSQMVMQNQTYWNSPFTVNHPGFSEEYMFTAVSNDSGQTWTPVDPYNGINIAGLVPSGWTVRRLHGSDSQFAFDKFGNLFHLTIISYFTPDPNVPITAFFVLAVSIDGGNSWTLVELIEPVNGVGLDYPEMAVGPGPNGSQVVWIVIKEDANFIEITGEGSSFPQMVAAYQTTSFGSSVTILPKQEIPGSAIGGYGTVAVDPKTGAVLVTGLCVNNSFGSLPFGNETLWYSYNPNGINGTFSPVTPFANSNTGNNSPNYIPEQYRATEQYTWAAIDNNGRWYIAYSDQPTPHYGQPNPNVYLIYSDNKGETWSTPVQLNNDVTGSSFQFFPQVSLDPKTNNLAVTWLDSREDFLDNSTRLWGTVIKNGSLPRLD